MNNDSGKPNSKEHLRKALAANVRFDDRKKTDFRDVKIEFDVSNTADGSAKITCGNTEILVGVSLTVGRPFPDRADEGALMVSCELLPVAHRKIESGPPSINAIEISRVIDRSIRESGAIDVKALCIVPGEKVWIVNVDVIPINHDGNIIDIGALGAIAAIQKTLFPTLDEDNVANYKEKTGKVVEVLHKPVPVTVCKIGDQLFIDPSRLEEEQLDARLTITVMEDDSICSLQKGESSGLTIDEVAVALDLAVKTAKDLRKNI